MSRPVIALAAACVLMTGFAPAKAELLVNISISQQRVSVIVDGAEAYRWPVSTGRRGHDTPAGKFRPIRLERHWYSHQYDMTPMPWAVFFHNGYAVHGTMEAYNLGHAASHGCVRLRPDNAAILFSLVRRNGIKNTQIVVMNGALPLAPGAKPLVDAGAPAIAAADKQPAALEHVAKKHEANAGDDGARQEYAAKAHRAMASADSDAAEEAHHAAHDSRGVSYRVSVGSDEPKILREREAWLRSLDRKYGITR